MRLVGCWPCGSMCFTYPSLKVYLCWFLIVLCLLNSDGPFPCKNVRQFRASLVLLFKTCLNCSKHVLPTTCTLNGCNGEVSWPSCTCSTSRPASRSRYSSRTRYSTCCDCVDHKPRRMFVCIVFVHYVCLCTIRQCNGPVKVRCE